MKVAKIKKQKNKKIEVKEESYSVQTMLKLILVILIAFIAFYLITYFVVKEKKGETVVNEVTEIDTSTITFNGLLNRKETEYYVLAYDSNIDNDKTDYITLYKNYINKYKSKEDSLSFYMIDIRDAFNKSYIDETLNISDNLDELKVNDEVLFKIKEGKIEKTYIGNENIIDKLSRL